MILARSCSIWANITFPNSKISIICTYYFEKFPKMRNSMSKTVLDKKKIGKWFFFKHVFILVDKLLLILLADDTKKVGKYWKVAVISYKDELIIQSNLKCLRSRKQNRLKFSQMPMDTQRTRNQTEIMDCCWLIRSLSEKALYTYIRWIYWLHINWMDHKTSLAFKSKSKCSRRHLQTTVFPTDSRHPA